MGAASEGQLGQQTTTFWPGSSLVQPQEVWLSRTPEASCCITVPQANMLESAILHVWHEPEQASKIANTYASAASLIGSYRTHCTCSMQVQKGQQALRS